MKKYLLYLAITVLAALALLPRDTIAQLTTNVRATIVSSIPTGSNSIGQVTANAGTNLNTSTLALQTAVDGLEASVDGLETDLAELASGVNSARYDVNIAKIAGSDPITANPCETETRTTDPISLTADTVIIAATSAKKNYICSLVVVAGAAEIVSITEGTGSTCGTGEAAIAGSTTDANGMSFAANGGVAMIGGIGTVLNGKTANVDTCLNVSGSNRVSGFVTWVQR